MAYNFNPLKQNLKGIEEWLKKEFAGIRTGRATPAILDGVKVEAYGSEMPISQVANISVEDARMLRITPWDAAVAKPIEKAILVSDLGLSVTVDDKGLRVVFPDLTSDRRASLAKVAKQKLEDAKISMRGEREKIVKDIDKQEKDGGLSKDDAFRYKGELQKIVDETTKNLEDAFAKKEKEITE
jgi:ribosome recycling factor